MLKKIIKVILWILICVIALAALFLGYLTVTEYKPNDVDPVEVIGKGDADAPSEGDSLRILSWNIGYAALGKDADFVMDGGGNAPAADKAKVAENLDGIKYTIASMTPDIVMLQEVDTKSSRSYKINEAEYLKQGVYCHAYNYKCNFVPFPWPPFGKVESGLETTTDFEISSAERYSLPCPFSWPLRPANLKRGLMASRISMDDGKELVIVNLHLEAYDSGEAKIAQTKVLLSFIEEEYAKGNYVIAGGDFNQTFPGSLDVYPNTHEDLWKVGLIDNDIIPDGFSLAYDTSVPTCRLLNQPYNPSDSVNTQYYVIDGFITSPNVKVDSVMTVDEGFEFSDHNPVILEITLK